jgi:methylthioribulose-1-phosphate dehydratase
VTTDHDAAIQSLIDAGRWLDAHGYAPATSGNYSLRVGPGRLLVTASGKHKGRLGREDFVVVDERGEKVGGGATSSPSAETALHALLFRLDPRVGAVIHTHSVGATVLGLSMPGSRALDLTGYEMLKALPGVTTHTARVCIPVFENSQDIPALAREVEARWREEPFPGYMLRGHGLYAWGEDLHLALRSAEALEFLVACELEKRRVTP